MNAPNKSPPDGHLTSANAWPAIELDGTRESARAFWTATLQFANADGATRVLYRPANGDDCLACEVDGVLHPMVPPPSQMQTWLFHEAKRLAIKTWRERANAWLGPLLGQCHIGHIDLETDSGVKSWKTSVSTEGLVFKAN